MLLYPRIQTTGLIIMPKIIINPITIIKQNRFISDLKRIKNNDITYISSNCIGGRIYETLNIPYLTPTVGMFLFPNCFLKLANNIGHYMATPPFIKSSSIYHCTQKYPILGIEDIELHCLHYQSATEATEKWERRKKRINTERIFIIMTDRDGFNTTHGQKFDELPFEKKVIFSSSHNKAKSAVEINAYKKESCVGDLYTNYHYFPGSFSFSEWANA